MARYRSLLSRLRSRSDRDKGLKLGANAYLTKPIQTNDLLNTVREILKIE
jgi:DNA-binding response OmpR family regulator